MSSKSRSGKRRGRKPKEAKDPTSEFPGMFVLPPNILQKLGINLNLKDVQHAQTISEMPVQTTLETAKASKSVIQADTNSSSSTLNNESVNEITADSSILETANLMKTSVFLSPTFIPPVSNPQVVNAEIEFVSINQDEVNPTAVEKQVIYNSQPSHTFSTPNIYGSHGKDKGIKTNKTVSVCDGYKEKEFDTHSKIIQNLREKINSTVANDHAHSEKKHVSQKTIASINSIVPNILAHSEQKYMSQKTIAPISTDEPERDMFDDSLPGTIMQVLSNASERGESLKYSVKNADEASTENIPVDRIQDSNSDLVAQFPAYLDDKTMGRSPYIIDALIQLNKAEEPLADEINELVTAKNECNTKLEDSNQHFFNGIDRKIKAELSSRVVEVNASFEDDGNDVVTHNDIDTQIIENIQNVITNDLFNLVDTHETDSLVETTQVNEPLEKPYTYLQNSEPFVQMDTNPMKENDRPEKELILLDDHLDEAYLSDCSNSYLGPSPSGSVETCRTQPKESNDVNKNNKISILSEEVIEPSRFNYILEKAKQSHQKENFIPVSISSVVSLHKYDSSNCTIIGQQNKKTEANADRISAVESSHGEKQSILIEFVDEYVSKDCDNAIQHQVTTRQNQSSSADTLHDVSVPFQTKPEEVAKKESLPCHYQIPDFMGSKQRRKKFSENSSEEKVEEIASYLSKFADLLGHRKNKSLNKIEKKQTFRRRMVKSRLSKEGVEKPGGEDKTDESQEEDKNNSNKVWRTYRISQKLSRPFNNNWDSIMAQNITLEKNISIGELPGIDDLTLELNISDDFGSLCYYETPEDLYDFFNSSKTTDISLIELLNETECYIYYIERQTAVNPDESNYAGNSGSINGNTEDPITHIDNNNITEDSKQNISHGNHNQVIDDFFTLEENAPIESKKTRNTRLAIFEAWENDINGIIDGSNLKKEEVVFEDCRNFDDITNHEPAALCYEESTVCQSKVQPNDSSKTRSREYKCKEEEEAAHVINASRMKRRCSSHNATISKDVTLVSPKIDGSEENSKKAAKCGVCQEKMADNEWNDHLSNEHCFIAWKDGETINLKSNALLSNLNSRLKESPPLRCTFCNAEYKTCKKFLSHIRHCLKKFADSNNTTDECDVTCGVCHGKVATEKWFEHITNRHHYIAWKEGQTSITLKNDVKRHLESMLSQYGSLNCSDCGLVYNKVDSYTAHRKTCKPTNSKDVVRRLSSGSESDMNLSDLRELRRTGRRSHVSSRNSSPRNSLASPEPPSSAERDGNITNFCNPYHKKNEDEACRQIFDDPNKNSDPKNTATKIGTNNGLLKTLNEASIVRRQSSASESDMNLSDLRELRRTSRRSNVSSRNSSPRNSLASPEPPSISKSDRKITNFRIPKYKTNEAGRKISGLPEKSGDPKNCLTITEIRKDNVNGFLNTPNKSSVNESLLQTPKLERKSRKSATDKTSKLSKNNKCVSAIKSETEIDKTKLHKPEKSEDHATKGDANEEGPIENKRKRIRLISDDISTKECDETLPNGHITEDAATTKDATARSRKCTPNKTPKNNRNNKSESNYDPGSDAKSNKFDVPDKNSIDVPTTTVSENQLKKGARTRDFGGHSKQKKAKTDLKNEGTIVECGVCSEKVSSESWMAHSQSKHQYLAWQTGEKPIKVSDETKVLEHFKDLAKKIGSLLCSKCGVTRKYPKPFLMHIRQCDVVANDKLDDSVEAAAPLGTVTYSQFSETVLTDNTHVTCAICSENMESAAWEKHAYSRHYNIAWPVGGYPIDRRNTWQIEKILKKYKSISKSLVCKVCGVSRASNLGFYAHILVCGKTKEEADEFKDTCGVCNQKFLCIYRQQHYSIHAQQEIVKERDRVALEDKEKISREKIDTSYTPGKRRKAAEKALQVLDNYNATTGAFKHQCPHCDFGTDVKLELGMHKCGQDFSDSDESAPLETEEDSDESAVDSRVSDEEAAAIWPKKKKKKSYDSKPRLMKVPFKIPSIKRYIKKGDEDFYTTHFTAERLFTEWIPSTYETIPDAQLKPYLPPVEESCKVKEDEEWKTYKRFEARLGTVVTLFAGGVPGCVSWAPPARSAPGTDPGSSYLAVACHAGNDTPNFDPGHTRAFKGLVQIWDFGQFDETLPRLALGIAHEYGAVWAMDWCPSGARDAAGAAARLGLLAVACSDGAAYVFAVPHPPADGSTVFYKLKPAVELRFDEQKQFHCTTIKWSMQKGHATIAVGYSNGAVAFYNLSGKSPYACGEEDGVCILYPYDDERVLNTPLTGLDLFASTDPESDRGLACAASNVGVALWASRGAAVARTLVHSACAGAAFQPRWPCVTASGDDSLAVQEVEWDGWRGRNAGHCSAACARAGLLCTAHPPLLRASLPHRAHYETPRKNVAAIEMKPLSTKRKKEKQNSEFEMKVEPLTYEKAVTQYGLELTLLSKERMPWPNTYESRPERFPLSDVCAMAFCPHPAHYNQMAAATHAGLIFLLDVNEKYLYPAEKRKS